jgi:hypothetical protein
MQADRKNSDRKKKQHEDERVDEAIRETFPASDPIAAGEATGTEPIGSSTDRRAPKVSREEVEHARKSKGHAQNDSFKRSR